MPNGTVAVTGGLGFVGSALTDALVRDGHRVMVIDDLSLGVPENLAPEILNEVILLPIDIRDETKLTRALRSFKPATIHHLAAIHFIPLCDREPARAISVNVEGTQSVLDASAACDATEAVVLASTAAVYAPSDDPHSEDSRLGPTDIYGHTKLWMEQVAQLFARRNPDARVGIARLFNAIGPGETNPHLLPTVIRQLQLGETLKLGNLTTQRDYIYTGDLAAGIVKIGQACREHNLLTCNLGHEAGVDGHTLVQRTAELFGREVTLETDPSRLRKSDRPFLVADCRRAHELLDWRAETDLDEALRHTLDRPVSASVDFV